MPVLFREHAEPCNVRQGRFSNAHSDDRHAVRTQMHYGPCDRWSFAITLHKDDCAHAVSISQGGPRLLTAAQHTQGLTSNPALYTRSEHAATRSEVFWNNTCRSHLERAPHRSKQAQWQCTACCGTLSLVVGSWQVCCCQRCSEHWRWACSCPPFGRCRWQKCPGGLRSNQCCCLLLAAAAAALHWTSWAASWSWHSSCSHCACSSHPWSQQNRMLTCAHKFC